MIWRSINVVSTLLRHIWNKIYTWSTTKNLVFTHVWKKYDTEHLLHVNFYGVEKSYIYFHILKFLKIYQFSKFSPCQNRPSCLRLASSIFPMWTYTAAFTANENTFFTLVIDGLFFNFPANIHHIISRHFQLRSTSPPPSGSFLLPMTAEYFLQLYLFDFGCIFY